MSDSNSDNEGKLAEIPFSWTPYQVSTFPLFLSESGNLSFLVIDDPISKPRIETIIKDYGGKICRNKVYSYSVVLVPDNTKPSPHWGAVYSRRWVKDCVTACSLKELNNYLIKGCQPPTVNEYGGSLTYSLFFGKFEFRPSPLNSEFFCKDVFVGSKDERDEKLVTCKICRSVERLENGESSSSDESMGKGDRQKVVCAKAVQDNIVGTSENPVTPSSSSDNLRQNNNSVQGSHVKQLSAKDSPVKKIVKRKLANLEDLINVGECDDVADRTERNSALTRDSACASGCHQTVTTSHQQQDNNPTNALCINHQQRPQQRPVNAEYTKPLHKRFKNGMKTKKKIEKRLTGSCEQMDESNKKQVPGDSRKQNAPGTSRLPGQSDSDSDSCVVDLRNWGRLKKFSVTDKHTKTKFTLKEKRSMLTYIVNKKAYNRLKSDALYREMEERNICPKRTYQSMKNHFLKSILKQLDSFEFLSDKVKKKIRGEENHIY